MMFDHGACPRCSQFIDTERRQDLVIVCSSCGFVLSNSEQKIAESSNQTFIYTGVLLAALMLGVFVQINIWDSYWLEIIPLEIKDAMGASRESDIERMAEICLDRKRLNCVEAQYARLAKKDSKQLLRLAKLQMSRSHFDDAVTTYRKFFVSGGKDLNASFNFAKALNQVGQTEEARKYYRYILRSRPDAIMQAAAQSNYDKLMKQKHAPEPAQAGRGIASVSSGHSR